MNTYAWVQWVATTHVQATKELDNITVKRTGLKRMVWDINSYAWVQWVATAHVQATKGPR